MNFFQAGTLILTLKSGEVAIKPVSPLPRISKIIVLEAFEGSVA